MNGWIVYLNFSILGAALLLSVTGLWFTVVIPGADSWSRRFFIRYFLVFMLCGLSAILETPFQSFRVPSALFQLLLFLENLLLSLPLPMLTVYLLHCCGEDTHSGRLFYTVFFLWAVLVILFLCSACVGGFYYVTPENQYYRGPLYPLLLLPAIAILLCNLAAAIRRRRRLSGKILLAFFITLLSMTIAMASQLFIDSFPVIGISYVISGLAMYSFILSDQAEKDRIRRLEIARQQQEIVRQQREIAHERASVMILQMRPHFIYNTLMSIYSLCRIDPGKARQVTMDFTNYLRRNFNAVASESTIPFSLELEHSRAYLAVEQAQFDDMLVVEYDTPFTNFRLPPLTLQPLAENAVKHGMDPCAGPLHVSIRTRRTESGSEITVEDNGRGFDPSDESRPKPTLTNIQQRLSLMCGGILTVTPRDGGGTEVKLSIPDSTAE